MTYTNKSYKEKIISIYKEKMVPELDIIALEMKSLLESILQAKAEVKGSPFNLVHNNSGYIGRYFKIVSRVKSGESLGGKLVIKDDLFYIKSNFPEAKEDEIIDILYTKYKDLIGIKILGDLQVDTDNILSLLKENKHNFIDANNPQIFMEFLNIDGQPDKMNNGKEIIKIDAVYNKDGRKFNFELQVKNQLLSAWGDMEHQQFYKNSKFSTVRKLHEPIMHHVGELLSKIDTLLLSIRDSETNYNKQSSDWNYHLKIQNQYESKLEELFGINVNDKITELSEILKLLGMNENTEFTNLVYELIDFIEKECIEFQEPMERFIGKYFEYRKIKIKLRVFEAITITWYSSIKGIESTSTETYLDYINWLYIEFLKTINNLYENNIEDENIPFNPIFYKLLENARSIDYFIELGKYGKVIEYYKFIKDVYVEWVDDKEQQNIFEISYFNHICYLGSQLILSNQLLEVDKVSNNPIKPIVNDFFERLGQESTKNGFSDINIRIKTFIQEGR